MPSNWPTVIAQLIAWMRDDKHAAITIIAIILAIGLAAAAWRLSHGP